MNAIMVLLDNMNSMQFKWDPASLPQTLMMLLKGMVGIFAVILVIWAFVAILNRATSKRGKSDS